MSSSPICASPQCDNPPHDGFLCQSCVGTLRRDLEAVPDLVADLMVTISRQDKIGDSDGRGSSEKPLPLRLGPMEAKRDLSDTLRAWSDHVAARRETDLSGQTMLERADWLSLHLGDVQDDPKAGDLADEIGFAVIVAQRAVDKPMQHRYVGPCDKCGADLYCHPKARSVDCPNKPECETTYNVEDRRAWLLEKVEDQLATAAELSRALPNLLQRTLSASAIRGYARRHGDKLPQKPPDSRDKTNSPRYRVGDLIALLHELRDNEHRTAC